MIVTTCAILGPLKISFPGIIDDGELNVQQVSMAYILLGKI